MSKLSKALTGLAYIFIFMILTLVFLRLTLDLNQLKPEIEKSLSQKTGAKCTLGSIEFQGLLGLSISTVQMAYPLSAELEVKWEKFRAYLKARRQAKEEGLAEPEPMKAPPQAPTLCLSDSQLDFGLGSVLSLVLGGQVTTEIETTLLSCEPSAEDTNLETPKRLALNLSTQWDGLSMPRRSQDLAISFKLNEIDLGESELIQDTLPLKVKGQILGEGEGHLVIGKLGRVQIKKSSATLSLNARNLQTEATTINALELPAVRLGEVSARLKLERGDLNIEEFKTLSDDIKGSFTGNIKLLGSLARTMLNLHIALDLSSEFITKNPDVKTIATLQRNYFTRRGDGGYDVGVLLKGRVNKPRATAAKNSPYSKEGRSLNRNERRQLQDNPNSNRNQRSKAQRTNRNRPANEKARRNRIKAGKRGRLRQNQKPNSKNKNFNAKPTRVIQPQQKPSFEPNLPEAVELDTEIDELPEAGEDDILPLNEAPADNLEETEANEIGETEAVEDM